MDSSGKAMQKQYRFPFFSLPREIRSIIYQSLFVTEDFVHFGLHGRCEFEDGTCETLKTIYEATTSLQFLQESLETFFKENYFLIEISEMPYLHNYGSLSLRTKELLSLPPYNPDIPIEITPASTLGQRLVKYPAVDTYWDPGEDGELEFLTTDEEENLTQLTLRKASDISTWVRFLTVSFYRFPFYGNLERCLLKLCKLPNLQHVTILTQAGKWPFVQRKQPAAAACLKELRSTFGKGFQVIYYNEVEGRRWRVPDSFLDLLCAQSNDREGGGEWEGPWLEEQFYPIEGALMDRLPKLLS